MVFAAMRLDKLGQSLRGHGVGDDCRARVLPEYYRSDECDERVAVDGVTIVVHDGRTVHVGVEDDTQVGMVTGDGPADCHHGIRALGVGSMVGEVSVRIQIDTTRGVSPQGLQYLLGEETTRSVARIDHDVEARQRLVPLVHLPLDVVAEQLAVLLHEVPLGRLAREVLFFILALLSHEEQFLDVLLAKATLWSEELQSVAVPGQVTCRHHDGTINRRLVVDGRHEHRWRRSQFAVEGLRTAGFQPLDDGILDLRA